MPRILYKFPTRGRKDKFFACIQNLIGNARHEDYFILVTADHDDEQMMSVMDVHKRIHIVYGVSQSKIDAVNRDFDIAKIFYPNWDIMVLVSDDFEFSVEGFDLRIIEHMQHYFPDGDGVLHYPDGTPNGYRLMTMSIMGRKYYERTNYVYHPDYMSVYADDEATEVAKRLNKYKFINEQLFSHNHWIWLRSKKDDLNIKNDSPEMYGRDLAVYQRRLQNNFDL